MFNRQITLVLFIPINPDKEEFEGVKAKLLAKNIKKEGSIQELKKWKKLLDQNVISQEEYVEIKAKIINKDN